MESDATSLEWVIVDGRPSHVRPDIALMRQSGAVAGIAVVRSHAVDAQGILWIEVAAAEELAEAGGWSIDRPLAALRTSDAADWRCARHHAMHAKLLRWAEERRAGEQEAARQSTRLVSARVADVYHAGGRRERRIYKVEELLTHGAPHTLRLERGGREIVNVDLSHARGGRSARSSSCALMSSD